MKYSGQSKMRVQPIQTRLILIIAKNQAGETRRTRRYFFFDFTGAATIIWPKEVLGSFPE
jgi:hypothetical protein